MNWQPVEHNLGTTDVHVIAHYVDDAEDAFIGLSIDDANTVSVPQQDRAFTCTVIGGTDEGVARYSTVVVPPFQVGDRADHVDGQLDPREVVAVEGDSIFIYIGAAPYDRVGPLPAENYRRIPKP